MHNTESIFISGAKGFVGKNLIKQLSPQYNFIDFNRSSEIIIKSNIVIHLAGKAHDLKKTSDPLEYYYSNTELTKKVFDAFLESDAKIFITLSSVKAVADEVDEILTENHKANPFTHYGISKLLAEDYINSKDIPNSKKVYILRPCMIHGPGNKGNLNFLYNYVKKGFPWPLGAFNNERSFLSIDNLCFVINEILLGNLPPGVYNLADSEALSTNEVIRLISDVVGKPTFILSFPKIVINLLAKLGDQINLPLNTERLQKLTQNYLVSNQKLVEALGKPLPVDARLGLIRTLKSFK